MIKSYSIIIHSSHLFKCISKILFYQSPALLSLEVIRVIISRAEDIGPEHDSSFDLLAKSFTPCLLIHHDQVRNIILESEAVFNAIISCRITAGLSRGNDVITAYRMSRVRQGDVNNFRAIPFKRSHSVQDAVSAPCVKPFYKIFIRKTNPETLDIFVKGFEKISFFHIGGGAVQPVMTAYTVEQDRAVFYAPGNGADLVKR